MSQILQEGNLDHVVSYSLRNPLCVKRYTDPIGRTFRGKNVCDAGSRMTFHTFSPRSWENYFEKWENYFGRAGGKIILAGGKIILAGQVGKLF